MDNRIFILVALDLIFNCSQILKHFDFSNTIQYTVFSTTVIVFLNVNYILIAF